MQFLKRKKKYILLLFTLLILFFLIAISVSSCALPEELNENNIINQFFPNFWVFLANLIALVILLFVIIFFLWKPTKRSINARTQAIQNKIDEAKKAKEEAEIYLVQANEKRLKAIEESQTIINNSVNEAYRIKSEIEEKAKRDANIIIQNARIEFAKQENKLRSQLHSEIINVALSATEALAQKTITKADHEKFVEEFISELEDIDFE
ncbi:F0F1 ATP synthase subunit B [Mycoplasmoides pirum]|uniref:F0F1 ATP synthase subunit B n=1 Tax=Mycoplasmoides pirum TaxID=2122 RepID=UPI00056512DE|nr:F0F1 ATP synthase subunit B [Mycoplasmoides pirum]